MGVSFLFATLSTLLGRLVPLEYLLPAIIVGATAVYLLGRELLTEQTSKSKRSALIVAGVIIIVGNMAILSINSSMRSLLSSIQPADSSIETYTILGEKSRNTKLATAKSAGMISADPYLKEAELGLKTKTAAKPKLKENTAELMSSLRDDELDTAVLNSSLTKLLSENYPGYDSDFEVLATFKVKVKQKNSTAASVDTSKPFIVYISGIDTYGPIASVSRSDVNMLAVVNPVTHTIVLVNTPRDYYVQLHGTTGNRDKLTHAGLYGIDMSRQTLEDLYGVQIDYYLRVNFTTLVQMIDTLGGVSVESDYNFKTFQKGQNYLDGAEALEFSRERYSFSEGDRQRGANQQKVIEAVIAKASTPSNAIYYRSFISTLQDSLQTNVSQSSISSLVNAQLSNRKPWTVQSISVTGPGAKAPTYSMGSLPLYVMQPDQASVDAAKTQINSTLAQ